MKSPAGWAWMISAALVRKETGMQERFSALPSWWYKQRQVEWSGKSRFREEYSFQRHSSSEFVKVSEQFTVQNYVQISTSPSIQYWGIQIKCSENYSSDKVIYAKWTEVLPSLNAVHHSQYHSVPKSTVQRMGIWETLSQFFPLDIMHPMKHHKVKGLLCGRKI